MSKRGETFTDRYDSASDLVARARALERVADEMTARLELRREADRLRAERDAVRRRMAEYRCMNCNHGAHAGGGCMAGAPFQRCLCQAHYLMAPGDKPALPAPGILPAASKRIFSLDD